MGITFMGKGERFDAIFLQGLKNSFLMEKNFRRVAQF